VFGAGVLGGLHLGFGVLIDTRGGGEVGEDGD